MLILFFALLSQRSDCQEILRRVQNHPEESSYLDIAQGTITAANEAVLDNQLYNILAREEIGVQIAYLTDRISQLDDPKNFDAWMSADRDYSYLDEPGYELLEKKL